MTATALYNSILVQAVEGHLVPQLDGEEDATVLLNRIRRRKEQLVKEKKGKADKPFKPIEESEYPIDLPNGWTVCRLGELGFYKKGPFGSALTKSMFVPKSPESVKVYEQKNAIQKDYSLGDYYITSEYFEKMRGFEVHSGDIIVSCAGTIGETYVIPPNAPVGIINQALMRVTLADDSIIDYWRLFFEYVLISTSTLNGNGSAIKNIPPFEILKNIVIPLPPREEQRRIIDKWKSLLPLIDKYGINQEELNNLNKTLPTKLRKSILQEAVKGNLVSNITPKGQTTAPELLQNILKGRQEKENKEKGKKARELTLSIIEEEPWDIPEGWCWCRIKDLCELSDATKKSGDYVNLDAAFLRGKSSGTLLKSGRFVKVGTRMILVDGENSGEVFIAPCDGYLGSTFKELSIYSPESAPYLLLFLLFNKELFRNNKKGAAIPHLNKDLFRNQEIPLPPLSIQHRIVEKIEEVFAVIDKLQVEPGSSMYKV